MMNTKNYNTISDFYNDSIITDLYKTRSYARQLYMNDTRLQGDIINDILELQISNKNIKTINVALDQFKIMIELNDNIIPSSSESLYEYYSIQTKLNEIISKFLLININSINVDLKTRNRIVDYIKNVKMLFDSYIISNCITIIL